MKTKIPDRYAVDLLKLAADHVPDMAGLTLFGAIERAYLQARERKLSWATDSVMQAATDAMDHAVLQWHPDGVAPTEDAPMAAQAAKNDGYDLFGLAVDFLRKRAEEIEKRRTLYESVRDGFDGHRRQLGEVANAFERQARTRLSPEQQAKAFELAALLRGQDWDRVISRELKDRGTLLASARAEIIFDPEAWPGVDAMAIAGAISDCHRAYTDLCRVYDLLPEDEKHELSPAGRPTP